MQKSPTTSHLQKSSSYWVNYYRLLSIAVHRSVHPCDAGE